MTAPKDSVSDLPGVLAEIEAVAGRDAALAIALAFGGSDLYVTRRGIPPAIADTIADGAWAVIVARFGGEIVHIPLARRHLVTWLAERGETTAVIARRLRIAQRTVRRYRRERRSGLRQAP